MRPDGNREERGLSERLMEEWIQRYGDGLLRLCLLQLGDHALAEDALQETFLRAWRGYGRFEGRSSEKTWLTAIAVNVCRGAKRSAWSRRTVSLEQLGELPAPDGTENSDHTVTAAVMKLPPQLREVVLMHELQGLKLREIAAALHMPLATAGSRLRRAKQRLRRDLEGWYFDEH